MQRTQERELSSAESSRAVTDAFRKHLARIEAERPGTATGEVARQQSIQELRGVIAACEGRTGEVVRP